MTIEDEETLRIVRYALPKDSIFKVYGKLFTIVLFYVNGLVPLVT
ncbi:hypothetical protein MESS2_p90051 [Mesorhizobium metallidurans STM 2683]|uniref:Uncharacterized protein n=1 Tax=Mesorhizobium metallidurans STM 2683 TaxID=1297569 RepID=M5EZL5_9HYPH|nr:hypothetical protein MESS2_p90051 [Mesorhizobium metallidurans STM 2683]